MRRRNRLPLEALAPYLLDPAKLPRPLAWESIFGNRGPVEIEVGFGKGLFLLTAAQANPSVNFLGIEVARKLQLFTANRIAKRELRNVRLIRADARPLFQDFLTNETCRAIHVYFPDPWWKKRHEKRRLFVPAFVRECERILQPQGRLHLATDVESYFRVMTELVATHTPLRNVSFAEPDLAVRTNFARKARLAGQPIYQAAYEKPALGSA